ncbi:MAG: hypothetical protein WCG92_16885 [Hyphomicrobiales bacterium]
MQIPFFLRNGVTIRVTCNATNGAVKCVGGASSASGETLKIDMTGSVSGKTIKFQVFVPALRLAFFRPT